MAAMPDDPSQSPGSPGKTGPRFPAMRVSSIAVLLLTSCALLAVEEATADVRLLVGLVPGVRSFADESQGVTGTRGTNLQAEFIYTKPLYGDLGLAYGLGGFMRTHGAEVEAPGGSHRYLYRAYGVDFTMGPALRLSPLVHLELRPYVDYGTGELADENLSGDGYNAYGVVFGGYATFPSDLQLGLELAYQEALGSSLTKGPNPQGIEIRASGVTANLILGCRF